MWSLGVSLLEVANNRFPFPPEGEPPLVGQFDLLNFIVNQPTPQLVDDDRAEWSDGAKDFMRLWSVPFISLSTLCGSRGTDWFVVCLCVSVWSALARRGRTLGT